MKELDEYRNFSLNLIASLKEFDTDATNFRYLFETIFNKDGVNNYASVFTDEQLREICAITRSIRDVMFSCIDTHILTIEHLADRKLCRRRVIDRDNKAKFGKTTELKDPKLMTKPVAKSKLEQLMELMNKATPEQLQQVMDNVKKGQ